ncbi:MAG: glycosyl transferase [Acidobacteria bacterium]|nr:glycosyl transferase [Acidobacteriota bacterium]
MTDFYQTGVVTTLHRLKAGKFDHIERQLLGIRDRHGIALVLPALWSEFEGPAFPKMIAELESVPYLNQIVVTISGATAEQLGQARQMLSKMQCETRFVWNNGPRIQSLYEELQANDLSVGPDGKGRSCWMAYGYVLASGKSDVIALHDCDILSYNRELLARLCYPVASPDITFDFNKGYYARVTNKMHGRVTRLFITPILRTLQTVFGARPLLSYLDSFRYPLAGEFAMSADLARLNRVPADWGLEIGMLAEVYRNCALKRICQTELCENYEHKHQALSAQDPSKGLKRMTVDIAKNLFRILASTGLVLSSGTFRTILVSYIRTAEDTITRYHADARIDDLDFDRHEEESAVAAFADAMRLAAESFMEDPFGAPLIPNWNRITAAMPGFLDRVRDAVDFDSTPDESGT